MKRTDCANAEALAGAIALGEANETERDGYRRHVATCADCLGAYGGEREIERVMATVAQARDEESWEPDLRAALRDRSRIRRTAWQIGLGSFGGALAAGVIASFAIHALVATGVKPLTIADNAPTFGNPVFHVSLERPQHGASVAQAKSAYVAPQAAAAAVPVPVQPQPRSVTVVHNVAAVKPAGVAAGIADTRKPSVTDESQIAALQTEQTTPPAYQHQAESIALAPREMIVREAALQAGSRLQPDPPSIAGEELKAEGLDAATTVYVVQVDERGVPTGCTIEKPSGILAIDEAVCKAAMKARFTPRSINGKAVSGTYRDAFVFLSN